MAHGAPETLLGFLERSVGDGVLAVGTYTDDGRDLHYARDDRSRDRVAVNFGEIVENIRNSPDRDDAIAKSYGSVEATLQLRENGVILHLMADDGGTLIGLERYVARDLDLFVRECAAKMYD